MQKRTSFALLILSLLLTSCGPLFTKDEDAILLNSSTRQFAVSNPTFSTYIDGFVAQARTHLGDPNFQIGDIPVNFGDTENPLFDGVCFIYSNGQREIIIRQEWWEAPTTTEAKREMLVFHELGHCRLNRDHDDTTHTVASGTFKTSIMNPFLPSTFSYTQHRDSYIEELFTESASSLLTALGLN